MRVRVQALLANYELRACVDPTNTPGHERVLVHSRAEARALLRRLLAEDPLASLRGLVLEVADVGDVDHDWLDTLAVYIVRGWIIVTRAPIEIMASETRERVSEPVAADPSELSGIRPEVQLRVSFEVAQPPVLVCAFEVEPPPTMIPSIVVEPPPIPEPDFQIVPPFTMVADICWLPQLFHPRGPNFSRAFPLEAQVSHEHSPLRR